MSKTIKITLTDDNYDKIMNKKDKYESIQDYILFKLTNEVNIYSTKEIVNRCKKLKTNTTFTLRDLYSDEEWPENGKSGNLCRKFNGFIKKYGYKLNIVDTCRLDLNNRRIYKKI